jgi:hypothetical protein
MVENRWPKQLIHLTTFGNVVRKGNTMTTSEGKKLREWE